MRFFNLYYQIFLILLPLSVFSTDYHVSLREGSDNNDGSQGSPWRSINKANAELVAGDRVFIHQGEYNGQQIAPRNSGTAGKPIVYLAFGNGEVVITDVKVGIQLDGRSHIHVQGIKVDGKRLFNSSTVQTWASLHDSHHCQIRDCSFLYAKGWSGVSIDEGSTYNRLIDNNFDYCGAWDDGKGQDRGDIISIKCAENNLLEGNQLRHGGHNLLAVYGRYNVIRNNIFDNSWGTDKNGRPIGNRCLELTNVEGKGCNGKLGGFNVFEDNIVRNGYRASDNPFPQMMKAQGENQIVRRNLIYQGTQEAIGGTANGTTRYARYMRIYHNTIGRNGGPSWRIQSSQGADSKENVFKNNISYDVALDPKNNKYSGHVFMNVIGSGEGPFNGNEIKGNCFYSKGGIDWLHVEGIGREGIRDMEGGFDKSISGNILSEPGFRSSEPRGGDDFRLKDGSELIDAGTALTRVRGNSGSGRVLQVEDARYFSDGFGIVEGDLIRIGKGNAVRIEKVDHASGRIELERAVSWQNGDPVNLDYAGNGPDIGAFESEAKGSIETEPEYATIDIEDNTHFGEIELGGNISKVISVVNNSDVELTISNIIFPESFTGTWYSTTIPAKSKKELEITFEPKVSGNIEKKIQIEANVRSGIHSFIVSGIGKKKIEVPDLEDPDPEDPKPNNTEALISFDLINTVTDQPLFTIEQNQIIYFKQLPTRKLSIEAKPSTEVRSIVFYIDNKEVHIENKAPYALAADKKGDFKPFNFKPGVYNLSARAYSRKNGAGKLLYSSDITFTFIDASNTDFLITSPAQNQVINIKETITISTNISNNNNETNEDIKVEFFVNGIKVGERSQRPYSIEWSTLTKGNHTISAKAIKNNYTVESPEVNLIAVAPQNKLPVVNIISPANKFSYDYAEEINFEVSALDADGSIKEIIFYNGDKILHKTNKLPYNFLWKYPEPGEYEITIVAIDNEDAKNSSTPLNIIVYPPGGPEDEEVFDALEEDIEGGLDVSYAPNPVISYLTVTIHHLEEGEVVLNIIDATGKSIYNKKKTKEKEKVTFVENLEKWAKGIYLAEIIFREERVPIKIVKQ